MSPPKFNPLLWDPTDRDTDGDWDPEVDATYTVLFTSEHSNHGRRVFLFLHTDWPLAWWSTAKHNVLREKKIGWSPVIKDQRTGDFVQIRPFPCGQSCYCAAEWRTA